MFSWQSILAIGIGGFIGAIFRAYAVEIANRYYNNSFAYGILFVNILGSLIIGMLFAYFSTLQALNLVKLFWITGFLGAFTTFSTFALDCYLYLNSSLYLAILNILSNLFGSIIAVFIGIKLFEIVVAK